jgi:hypothetical protein
MRSAEIREPAAEQHPVDGDLSLQHLEAALARVDVLLRRAVRRWQLAGQDPADAFRGLYVSDAQTDALLARPLGTNWGYGATLSAAETAAFAQAERQAAQQTDALAESARSQGHPLRLERLASAFDLTRFEMDTLLICLAPTLDLRYERLYGYLQDDVTRRRPSVNLVLDLLCEPGRQRLNWLVRFGDRAPLFAHQILERVTEPGSVSPPLLGQSLVPDETVVAWLLGNYRPHTDLGPHARLLRPGKELADALLAGGADRCNALSRLCLEHTPPGLAPSRPLAVFHGPDEAGQRAAARWLAAQMGHPLLTVDLDTAVEGGLSPLRVVRRALRDARLTGALAVLAGWDACLEEDGRGAPPPDLLEALCRHPGPAIVAGRASWQPKGIDRDRHIVWLEFPIPSYAQRRALWEHYVACQASEAWQPSEVNETPEAYEVPALASQFQLTTGQIGDAVASAKDMAAQRGEPLAAEHLFAAARAHSNPRLSSLARQIVPRYGWDDIVLPDDALALLREMVATVRGRPQVLDAWRVGQKLVSSRGVTALFSGPPGTGKTMGAEIIAAELRLDLYKIDLSTVVSKYIGETEKNLERIFNEAEQSNAILFFDEADALFGKRSEVRDSHDRYANIEISYLLQRMEAYDGVTILATNLRANLDEAFTRRLQFAVDFPFPEEEDRLRIWHTLFPPEVPREAGLDFGLLARRFRLAGGNIRNVLVSAAYLAASDGFCVTMDHLLHAVRRELQKMGRLVDEEDLFPGRR